MDQVKIILHKDMCDDFHVRYKFDIIVTNEHGAQHFSFVRRFALFTTEILHPPDRAHAAKILREEHRTAWERYHAYTETT
jgi:hypothetical protein